MFGNLGMGEILLILIVVLLLFGAKRIPEIAGSMGKGIREFKRSMNDVQNSIGGIGDLAPREDRPRARPMDVGPRPEPPADDSAREPKRLLR